MCVCNLPDTKLAELFGCSLGEAYDARLYKKQHVKLNLTQIWLNNFNEAFFN